MQKDSLEVLLVQSDIKYGDEQANLDALGTILCKNAKGCDLVVLPEMFATAYIIDKDLAKNTAEHIMQTVQAFSKEFNLVICGSLATCGDGLETCDLDGGGSGCGVVGGSGECVSGGGDTTPRNTFVWFRPNGKPSIYHKVHLFSMAKEDKVYAKGLEHNIIEEWGWKILPNICYDIRFPNFCRNTYKEGLGFKYDLSIFVASWPKARTQNWKCLLEARAVENQSFIIGVNRAGKDAKNIEYGGGSAAYKPNGDALAVLGCEKEFKRIRLEKNFLQEYRNTFPVYLDWD